MSFAAELAEFVRANSNIGNIEVYAGGFPAPKTTEPSMVGIFQSGTTNPPRNRELIRYVMRFLVSGSAESSESKATELRRYFIPVTPKPAYGTNIAIETTSYWVNSIHVEKEPSHIRNNNNIYIADFTLRFLTALL